MTTTRKYRIWGLFVLGVSANVQLVRCQSEYTGQGVNALTASWQDPYSYQTSQPVAAAPRQDIAGLLASPIIQLAIVGALGLVVVTVMQGQVNGVRDKANANENSINTLKNQIEQLTQQVAAATAATGPTTTALLSQQKSIAQNCAKVNEILGKEPLTPVTISPAIQPAIKQSIEALDAKINEILGIAALTC